MLRYLIPTLCFSFISLPSVAQTTATESANMTVNDTTCTGAGAQYSEDETFKVCAVFRNKKLVYTLKLDKVTNTLHLVYPAPAQPTPKVEPKQSRVHPKSDPLPGTIDPTRA